MGLKQPAWINAFAAAVAAPPTPTPLRPALAADLASPHDAGKVHRLSDLAVVKLNEGRAQR
jgi:hypothetical protein